MTDFRKCAAFIGVLTLVAPQQSKAFSVGTAYKLGTENRLTQHCAELFQDSELKNYIMYSTDRELISRCDLRTGQLRSLPSPAAK